MIRTTVGPLPAAIYWRRRILLLSVLAVVLVAGVAFARSGEAAGSGTSRDTAADRSTPKADDTSAPDQLPYQDGTPAHPWLPGVGQVPPPATASPSASRSPSPAPPKPAPRVTVAPKPAGPCANTELRLTATVDRAQWRLGSQPRFHLVVRNISTRSCTRDLGATQQELRVVQGRARLWSSDDCQPSRGSAVTTLKPGEQRTYDMTWSGKTSTRGCTTTRTLVKRGNYQVLARLGTLVSPPMPFAIV